LAGSNGGKEKHTSFTPLFQMIIRLSKMQHKYAGLFKVEQNTHDLHSFFQILK